MSRDSILDFVEEDDPSELEVIDPAAFDNNPPELWVQGYDEDESEDE